MKKRIIVFCFLLPAIILQAQKTCKLSKFEIELMNFKYSLYDDLGGYDYPDMQDFSFLSEGKPLRLKVDKFIEDNKEEIKEYQEAQFKRYEVFEIDTSNFILDTLFHEFEKEINNSDDLIASHIGDFFKVNPFVYFNTLQSFIVSRKYSAMDVGKKYLKNSIALPKIATKKMKDDKWIVFIDENDMAYMFSFEIKTMHCELLGIYERKLL